MAASVTSLPAAGAPVATNKWMIAVAVALGALLEVVDTSIVNVALNEMQNSLGATLAQVSWVVSSYAVANVIILPLTAWLGDRFGKKRYFIFSLIAFTLASVLCGAATSLPVLIVARVLQGLGGGGLMAKAQSILFETFPKKEQPAAQGFFGAIVIAGPAIGPTLGGYLVSNVNWRWIFFVNVPVGIAAFFMCLVYLPNDPPQTKAQKPIDWLAIGLLAVGLGSMQTFLEEGQSEDWFDSPYIVACAVATVVALVVFVERQLSSDRPVVDLRVLRHRSLWAGSILSITVGMGLYGALFAIPIFAQSILRFSSQDTGMLLLPGALASAVAMPVAAKLNTRFDSRVLIVAGGMTIIFALMMLTRLTTQTGTGDLFWPLIIRSFGTVLMFLPLNMATLGPIPKKDVAAATGFFSLTRQVGGSIAVAVLATLLSRRQTFHHAVLVEKLGSGDPQVLQRLQMLSAGFVQRGFDPDNARAKAMALLEQGAQAQAAVLSFGDTFWATAFLFITTLPLVMVLRKSDNKNVEMGH